MWPHSSGVFILRHISAKSRGGGLSGHPQMEHRNALPAGQGCASTALVPFPVSVLKYKRKGLLIFQFQATDNHREEIEAGM